MKDTEDDLSTLGAFFSGSRISVLLIHGLTGTPTELTLVARRLNQYGFTVLCPLLAGHCASEAALTATTWQDWAQSVLTAHERLAARSDAVFVGGLSAGAVLSLYTAHKHPQRVRGLTLFSTTLWWDGWAIPRLRFLLPLILRLPYIGKRYRFEEAPPYGIKNEPLRRKIVARMHSGDAAAAGFSGTPGCSLRELWRLVDVIKGALPQMETPTLLLHSSHDDIAGLSNPRYIQRHLKGPSKLVLLHDSYHMITVDQERRKVADHTAAFAAALLSEVERAELASCAGLALPEPEKDAPCP